MADPQSSRFWRAALQSGLLDAQALSACYEAISPSKRDDLDHIDRRLARQAVLSQVLTLWQAQQLMAGRTSGYKVDRYVLLEMIGQGGMGRVYLARDTRLNRRVALKILSPERINNPRAIARFQREARVGAQLQHENLVRIYDFGESNGRYYLVMEYIEGKTIGAMIAEGGPIPAQAAVKLVRQVALGLEHAHRKGLIHRDVNPYNIMVTHDGTAKLADLGLAIDLADDDHVTREGATVGTFDYVAPEQARHSHAADIRSDIYSLGCSIYHMLTGHVPFPTPSLPEKLYAHQTLEPKPMEGEAPGIPPALARVVARMMRKDPQERFATPLEVSQALEPFAEGGFAAADLDSAQTSSGDQATESPPRPNPFYLEDDRTPPIRQGVSLSAYNPSAEPVPAVASAVEFTQPSVPTEPVVAAAEPQSPPIPTEASNATQAPQPPPPSSDPDFPLSLDFGPEPSLTDNLPRPKSRTSVTPANENSWTGPGLVGLVAKLKQQCAQLAQPGSPSLWMAAGVLLAILTVVVFLAFVGGKPAPEPEKARRESGKTTGKSKQKSEQEVDLTKNLDFVLKTGDSLAEEVEGTPKTLEAALQAAMGNRGWWVELRNQKPIKIARNQVFDFTRGTDRLTVRAAPGMRPVLEIESGRTKPLFSAGSNLTLEIEGVTFLAQAGAGPASNGPALIFAAGKLRMRNSRLSLKGGTVKGSRAISCEGVLDVTGCFLEGFDRGIEIRAVNSTPIQIKETMFVPSTTAAPDWYGWALRVDILSSVAAQPNAPGHRLVLDHCTIDQVGFLELASGTSQSVLQIDAAHCAIHAEALLACPGPPNNPSQAAIERIRWFGSGNQLDITGKSWILVSAERGTAALSKAVVDLDSWLKTAAREEQIVRSKIQFKTEPRSRIDPLEAADFAIQGEANTGANPARVGPGRTH